MNDNKVTMTFPDDTSANAFLLWVQNTGLQDFFESQEYQSEPVFKQQPLNIHTEHKVASARSFSGHTMASSSHGATFIVNHQVHLSQKFNCEVEDFCADVIKVITDNPCNFNR